MIERRRADLGFYLHAGLEGRIMEEIGARFSPLHHVRAIFKFRETSVGGLIEKKASDVSFAIRECGTQRRQKTNQK